MLLRVAISFTISLILVSCASKKAASANSNQREFVCGGNYDSPPEQKTWRSITTIKLGFAIKDGDSTNVTELTCRDSIKFTRAFYEFVVSEYCIEMGIQGTAYFSARTNKYGGFEDVKLRRSADNCFHKLEEKIVLKVAKMGILNEEYFNSHIEFAFEFRLRSL